jgi:transcriptional regulator with GAF, ATPase, and Fis domain
MKTIIDEAIAPSTNASDWGSSRAAAFVGLATETKSDDLNQSCDDKPVFLRKRTGIEAICIWLNVPMPASVPFCEPWSFTRHFSKHFKHFEFSVEVLDWIRNNERPLFIDAEKDTHFTTFSSQLKQMGIMFFCGIPLIHENRLCGALGLGSTEANALCEYIKTPMVAGTCNSRRTIRLRPGKTNPNEDGIIGDSQMVEVMRHQIGMVAKTDSTVLVLGETGTGKELVAKAIHKRSLRSSRPFIKVNCAAIPSGLLESELYGHERGAFTGALRQRIGRFELANGGTLFLDEIGDIPLELQPKLLRVLQEQEFERVGGTQTLRVDVRVIAATSRDLDQMLACGEFRSDLYYRLNVFPLQVPALRDRPNDILELVCHFVKLSARKLNKIIDTIPADLVETLIRHHWPGNIRELQHFVERSVILSSSNVLTAPLGELERRVKKMANLNQRGNLNATTLKEIERKHIVEALTKSNWIVGGLKGAATKLGLPRTTLITKMQKFGILSDEMPQSSCGQ